MSIFLWILIALAAIPATLFTIMYILSIPLYIAYIMLPKGSMERIDINKIKFHLRRNINDLIKYDCILGILILIKYW
jgi:hypothetical protein